MKALVVGGAGALGKRVVAELRARGVEATAASRRSGVDLTTGAGLDQALAGVDTIVHCATNPLKAKAVDVRGTQHLANAVAAQRQPAHLVYISIVGCDANPYPYYRAKTAAEEAIRASGVPATVVRATQFHSLTAQIAKGLTVGPLAFSLGDMASQSVDVDWVAARLADYSAGPRPQGLVRSRELAGPRAIALGEAAALVREHVGRGAPRVLRIPPLGGTLRAFSNGSNLPQGDPEIGGTTFEKWLAAQPRRLPRH